MTLTGNCPETCPNQSNLACLQHDANVPDVALASLAQAYLDTKRGGAR